ncbi:ATP-binding cassette domain-containing protein [Saccharibacillus sp. CPCC 101409]|uniref:methionine ABC transporter ATP-binding protein n=1 Tax=Saccharibacillus sp. CPCC 101409 TaxID=3058041 RepID=UPI0026714AFE|nr:ATP-binding cassette domain-containing protein [Saccharibacillus sp. CPCC 101409]MDO3408227.1 ATP-binding cassette domain-containing protein [Saccharibacillus sp. CPCC 101409]
MLSLQEVSKTYTAQGQTFQAVLPVSMEIETGGIHGIIGTSGAGKSTLLRLMNLLERPDTGRVLFEGRDLTAMGERELRAERRSIGMIFQQFNLVHNRTVHGNVAAALELAKTPKRDRERRIAEVLKFVGLQDKARQYSARLSGGQKQRVGIARALASSPKLLLCDEPTSALDPQTTEDLLNVLLHINRTLGVTIVVVTHEMEVVRQICTTVSVMEMGETVDTFHIPRSGAESIRPKLSYREQILGTAREADR